MELKKEDIIKVLENNTVWFEALYEDLIHKGRFDDIADEIVKLTIPVAVSSADFEKPSFQEMRKKVIDSKQFTKKDGLYYHRQKGWKNLREAYEIAIS